MRNKYWRLVKEASQGFFAASVVGCKTKQAKALINRIKRWWETNKWGEGLLILTQIRTKDQPTSQNVVDQQNTITFNKLSQVHCFEKQDPRSIGFWIGSLIGSRSHWDHLSFLVISWSGWVSRMGLVAHRCDEWVVDGSVVRGGYKLSENIWFAWTKLSISGEKVGCYQCLTTNQPTIGR